MRTCMGVCVYVCRFYNTVIYQLIATATVSFSKQKGSATKQGWVLYNGDHETLVEYPSSGI